jgi:hypothetical protein
MSLKRYFNCASVLAIGGLLTVAEAQAQKRQSDEMGERPMPFNERFQLENGDRFNASNGSFANKKETEGVTLGQALKSKQNEGRLIDPDGPVTPPKAETPKPLSLPIAAKLTLLDKAYLDAFSILREDNACSRFYGGPPAIEVLNRLTRQLKPGYFDRSIGLRMWGKTTLVYSYRSGLSYRLFEKADLNLNGSFYRSSVFPNDAAVPDIGQFLPNTREARVAILLHEIGHMIQTPDNHWVLPDDGNDPDLSQQNTLRVIAVCRDQITGLSRIGFAQELSRTQTPPASKSSQVAGAPQPGQ